MRGRRVIAVAEAIPFAELTQGSSERLYALKGEVVARGVRAVLGIEMPRLPQAALPARVAGDPRRVAAVRAWRGAATAGISRRCSRRVRASAADSAHPQPRPAQAGRRRLAGASARWSRASAGRADPSSEPARCSSPAAECPFTCSFCDLWRCTIDGPDAGRRAAATDPRRARLARCCGEAASGSSSTTPATSSTGARSRPRTSRASPRSASRSSGVTVESHAGTLGAADARVRPAGSAAGSRWRSGSRRCIPTALARLNKRLDLDALRSRGGVASPTTGSDLRVFVLLGAPYVPAAEAVEWAVRSGELRGAARGRGRLDHPGARRQRRARAAGRARPVHAAHASPAGAGARRVRGLGPAVVTADLWDAQRLDACHACRPSRLERMRLWNETGVVEPPVACHVCANGQRTCRRAHTACRREGAREVAIVGSGFAGALLARVLARAGLRRRADRARQPPALRDRRVVDAAGEPLARAARAALRLWTTAGTWPRTAAGRRDFPSCGAA